MHHPPLLNNCANSGLSWTRIADKMNVSGQTLYRHLDGDLSLTHVDPTAAITISYITLFWFYFTQTFLLYLTFQYDNIVGIAMTIIMMTSK